MIRALAIAAVALVCAGGAIAGDEGMSTTSGTIAIANLDHQIAQARDDGARIELLLARSRYLGDYAALDRAVAIAETPSATGEALLRRAKTRAAVHRFADALADLDAAQRAGIPASRIEEQKTPILIAIGRASEAVPALEIAVERDPGYATHAALATAYAELGSYEQADREHAAALAGLRTTLAHLPQFAVANVHVAELEAARGEFAAAAERLERVVAASEEPEARALLGEIRRRHGDRAGAARDIDRARRRYEALLARHPLAFADHAAEFYLGPGDDAERARALAELNLANRPTRRAAALATRAAAAADGSQAPAPTSRACRRIAGTAATGPDHGPARPM